MPLIKVLNEIEKQTKFSFIYGKGLMEKSKTINIDVKAMPVDEVLEEIFKGQPF